MAIIVDKILFDNLLRARNDFEEFREEILTKKDKAACIQAFEYTFELSWKTMRKIIEQQGDISTVIGGSHDVIHIAADINLIDNPKRWRDFIHARNTTSHTYNEADADNVIAVFDDFSKELTTFLKKAGAL